MNQGDTKAYILRQLTRGDTRLRGLRDWGAPFTLIDNTALAEIKANPVALPLVDCVVVRQLKAAGYIEEVAGGTEPKEITFRISEERGLLLQADQPPRLYRHS